MSVCVMELVAEFVVVAELVGLAVVESVMAAELVAVEEREPVAVREDVNVSVEVAVLDWVGLLLLVNAADGVADFVPETVLAEVDVTDCVPV